MTWILWFVFVAAGDVWSVPLDRYPTFEACDQARLAITTQVHDAVFICIQSPSEEPR